MDRVFARWSLLPCVVSVISGLFVRREWYMDYPFIRCT